MQLFQRCISPRRTCTFARGRPLVCDIFVSSYRWENKVTDNHLDLNPMFQGQAAASHSFNPPPWTANFPAPEP